MPVSDAILSKFARKTLLNWYGPEMLTVPILAGTWIGWLFGLMHQLAVTINGTVYLTPRAQRLGQLSGLVLVAHELYHAQEQRELGWMVYLGKYLRLWRPWHIWRGKEHPMEVGAYERSREVWKWLSEQDSNYLTAQLKPESD